MNSKITTNNVLKFSYENKDQHQRSKLDFIEGAKWMKERMYSEEEVIELLNEREDYLGSNPSIFDYLSNKEWFEQFKKK